MRLVSYCAASSAAGPFRNGPAGLVVGFLADIISLSLSAAMCSKEFRLRCEYQQYGGDGSTCCRCRHSEFWEDMLLWNMFPSRIVQNTYSPYSIQGMHREHGIDVEVIWRHKTERFAAQRVTSKVKELRCCKVSHLPGIGPQAKVQARIQQGADHCPPST